MKKEQWGVMRKVAFWLWLMKEILLFYFAIPLRLLFSLLVAFMWKPAFSFNQNLLEDNGDPHEKYREYVKSFNPYEYVRYASLDQAKFLGMYLAVHPSEENKKLLMSYITKDGYFTRKAFDRVGTWSGDMTAGWLYAFTSYLREGLIDETDIVKFVYACRRAFFEKPYCQHMGLGEEADRGFLFRWWFVGHDFVVLLAVLTVLKRISGEKKWEVLYSIFRLLSFPWIDLFPESSIQRGKLFWVSWYASHSRAVLASAVLNIDPENRLFKRVLRKTYEKHRFYNPDIVAIYSKHFGWDQNRKEFAETWLRDYTGNKARRFLPEEWRVEYIHIKYLLKRRNIKEAKFVASRFVLPTKFRNNEYLWEKDVLAESFGTKSHLDYMHLYKLWRDAHEQSKAKTYSHQARRTETQTL